VSWLPAGKLSEEMKHVNEAVLNIFCMIRSNWQSQWLPNTLLFILILTYSVDNSVILH
jgi:hypothetical protein